MIILSKWFIWNVLVLVFAAVKYAWHPHPMDVKVPMLIGFIGLLFYLFNWTRHAVFQTIRLVQERKTKIKIAQVSRKVVPFHHWIGTTALLFVIWHAVLAIRKYGGFSFLSLKMGSGLAAGAFLLMLVLSGWIRLFYSTVMMRKIHLYLGMVLFFLIVVHLLL